MAEDQGLSGIALALNIAAELRRSGVDRGSEPGEFVFWHRFVCEMLSAPALDRAWRKALAPPPAVREPRRARVPTAPIDGSGAAEGTS